MDEITNSDDVASDTEIPNWKGIAPEIAGRIRCCTGEGASEVVIQ